MDELEVAIDLGHENDQQLARLRRALVIGSGFQLIFVELSHRSFLPEIIRRLQDWSGKAGVPELDVISIEPGDSPVSNLRKAREGVILVGLDPQLQLARAPTHLDAAGIPVEARNPADSFTALNWYRDELPVVLSGPLLLILSPDGLRELFVHAPDLLAWRAHTTRISTPRPVDVEVRPRPSRNASLAERSWLERVVSSAMLNPEGALTRELAGWQVRLGEIDSREGTGDPETAFSNAEKNANGRGDLLFRIELARARRALDERRLDDAEAHEGRAADLVAGASEINKRWDLPPNVPTAQSRRGPGWVSHDAIFAELRCVRAERLFQLGQFDQALTVAETALSSAQASGDQALVLNALAVLGAVLAERGDRLSASARFAEMRDVARLTRDHAAEVFALIRLAELEPNESAARVQYGDAILCLQADDYEPRARVYLAMATNELRLGNPDVASAMLRTSIESVSELRRSMRVRVELVEAEIARVKGDHRRATELFKNGWEVMRESGQPSRGRFQLSLILGDTALRAGNSSLSSEAYQDALEIAQVLADPDLMAMANRGLSRRHAHIVEPGEPSGRGPQSGRGLTWRSLAISGESYGQANRTPRPSVDDATILDLAGRFRGLDVPADAIERITLLQELARRSVQLGRRRDAALCLVRAAWDAPAASFRQMLEAWVATELDLDASVPTREELLRALDAHLVDEHPSENTVRAVSAICALGAAAEYPDHGRVRGWLDQFDDLLDMRTLWLARLGLSKSSRDLEHTRDRILSRLAGGILREADIPEVLRINTRDTRGRATIAQLRQALEELYRHLSSTKRRKSPVEAPEKLTKAYVKLQFAYGFAQLGNHEGARDLWAEAQHELRPVSSDPVHAFLLSTFGARLVQAMEGTSGAPLGEEYLARHRSLDRVTRYKVDRLREASYILEPFERLDPIGDYRRYTEGQAGISFNVVSSAKDSFARDRAIERIIQSANGSKTPEETRRRVEGLLAFLFHLPAREAIEALAKVIPLIAFVDGSERAVCYAQALLVASHFGESNLVRALLEHLSAAIRGVSSAALNEVLQRTLHSLRQVGLRREMAELLADVERAIPSSEGLDEGARARLALAAGMAFLGETSRAWPAYEEARQRLDGDLHPQMRLDLTRALALAYAHMPLASAIDGILELSKQFRGITDSFGTNTHYCLAVLHFVESLVLGLTSDELVFGEAGRRFVEDDEHLIRRRLHADIVRARKRTDSR